MSSMLNKYELNETDAQPKDIVFSVFGFVRQTVIQLFRDIEKFNDALSLLQFLCLNYYWDPRNTNAQFECIKQMTILLTRLSANQMQIRAVVDCGIVPRLIESCKNIQRSELQYESLFSLINIASGPTECVAYLIRNSVHNICIDLILTSPLYEIKEEALWVLGNIAGVNTEFKDLLLNNNILSNILSICTSTFNKQASIRIDPFWQFMNLLKTASRTVGNLCGRSPAPTLQHLQNLIKCLHFLLIQALRKRDNKFIEKHKNEIIMRVGWGFDRLTYLQSEACIKMLPSEIIKQFVNLLNHKNWDIRWVINRIISNIFSSDIDEPIKQCLNLGILSKYYHILQNVASDAEKREICFALSNICVGPIEHKFLVLKSNLFQILIGYLHDAKYTTSTEALWAIRNATTIRNKRIINPLINFGVCDALCSLLQRDNVFNNLSNKIRDEMLLNVHDCIVNILIGGNKHLCEIERNKLLQCLKHVQVNCKNINDEVYEKCVVITKWHQPRIIRRLCKNCKKREKRNINCRQRFKMCSCKMYKYCSRRCQKIHWKNQHRFEHV